MLRVLAIVSGLALVSALAPAAPVPKGAEKPSVYYFPTTVGTKWVYQTLTPFDSTETMVVTKVEAKGEVRIVSSAVVTDDELRPQWDTEVSPKGLVVLHRVTGDDSRLCLLKLPLDAHKKWEYEDPLRRGVVEVVTSGPEKVTVPAGTFRAVRVVRTFTESIHGLQTTSWFAPGVGEIKRSSRNFSRVLKSFTPGKP